MFKESSTIELNIPRIRIIGPIVMSQRDLNSCWLFSTSIHLAMIAVSLLEIKSQTAMIRSSGKKNLSSRKGSQALAIKS